MLEIEEGLTLDSATWKRIAASLTLSMGEDELCKNKIVAVGVVSYNQFHSVCNKPSPGPLQQQKASNPSLILNNYHLWWKDLINTSPFPKPFCQLPSNAYTYLYHILSFQVHLYTFPERVRMHMPGLTGKILGVV